MERIATIRPVPATPPTGGSLAIWIWLAIALAIVVIGGYVLASRR